MKRGDENKSAVPFRLSTGRDELISLKSVKFADGGRTFMGVRFFEAFRLYLKGGDQRKTPLSTNASYKF